MKSLYEKIIQLQENKKMRNYMYKDHAESKNYDYNHDLKKIENKNRFP